MDHPPPINWRRNLLFATIGVVVAGAAFNLTTPFLPLFLEELGARRALAQWAGLSLAAPALTYSLMAPIWGTLADRYGKRVMLLRSGIGIAATYVLISFSRTPWQLVLFRTINGTLGGFIPSCTLLIAANTPAADLGFALGVVQTASSVGAIAGPLIGGAAAKFLGIRYAFYFGAGLLIAAALTSYFGTREAVNRREGKESVLAGLRASMARRDLVALFLMMLATQTALMAVQPTLPLQIRNLAQRMGGRDVALIAGLVFSVTGLSTALGAPLIGRLHLDQRRVLRMGLILACLLHALQGLTGRIDLLIVERFFFGFANAAILVTGNVLIAQGAPEDRRGQVFGLLNAISSLGSIIGPLLGGYIAGRCGLASPFYLSALLFAAGFFLIPRPSRT